MLAERGTFRYEANKRHQPPRLRGYCNLLHACGVDAMLVGNHLRFFWREDGICRVTGCSCASRHAKKADMCEDLDPILCCKPSCTM